MFVSGPCQNEKKGYNHSASCGQDPDASGTTNTGQGIKKPHITVRLPADRTGLKTIKSELYNFTSLYLS